MLENNGIIPTVSAELSREALREGRDTQLEKAVEVVNDWSALQLHAAVKSTAVIFIWNSLQQIKFNRQAE